MTSSQVTLTVDELSPSQLKILIKVQDPNFWNHKGVEFSTASSGWTTITKAIAKWFYFHPFKQGIRKIKQTLLARFILHYQLTKPEPLLIFINYVWFNHKVTGFRNAVQHFYQKDTTELTEDEFISLMAMPIAPKKPIILLKIRKTTDGRCQRIKNYLSGKYIPKGLFDIYYGQ
ncbi:MAG: transglycosylase domain-containing protein [Proteobacteria bacterium]|nr:transglycosylase domain-containing protein [Pseudomonadota bacterium]